ncbi:MAG: SpoIIIAH-like family protein [Bacilli bacterium]
MMVNKKNIWFLTLFSLILVLSIYYLTMPNDILVSQKEPKKEKKVAQVETSTILVALRVEGEEEYLNELDSLKTILTNAKSTVEEKNNAFEQMKNLNVLKGEQEQLESKINSEIGCEVFVKIDKNQIKVVIDKKEHDAKLANKIMRLVQSNYQNKMYITVKFQSSK